ncbi:uncharacterized protein RCC_05954 [Ramularia collo-cygni]|uniref:Uncharacterized protein n=1 Tax=Ramularia collo-cygni TaxID=112498 RepID=A0A2D3V5W1_9PEZI|nr:uncharacterized protein RCC_05954 [Ramularia collo-cygni]CZT20097.1 uncharacterized protein RCC_05954 [Ramularia collo-cygni]
MSMFDFPIVVLILSLFPIEMQEMEFAYQTTIWMMRQTHEKHIMKLQAKFTKHALTPNKEEEEKESEAVTDSPLVSENDDPERKDLYYGFEDWDKES